MRTDIGDSLSLWTIGKGQYRVILEEILGFYFAAVFCLFGVCEGIKRLFVKFIRMFDKSNKTCLVHDGLE